jgi:hypothetical protein
MAAQIRKLRQRFRRKQVVAVGIAAGSPRPAFAEEIPHPAYLGERWRAGPQSFTGRRAETQTRRIAQRHEQTVGKFRAATQRKRRPLGGRKEIGLAVGQVLGHYKIGKHLQLTIEEDRFDWKQSAEHRAGSSSGWYL